MSYTGVCPECGSPAVDTVVGEGVGRGSRAEGECRCGACEATFDVPDVTRRSGKFGRPAVGWQLVQARSDGGSGGEQA